MWPPRISTIRWLISNDLPEILEIEKASFTPPWTREDFKKVIGRQECIGQVIDLEDETIGGYMIYDLEKGRLRLVTIAVHPRGRRRGFARALMEKLKNKLTLERPRIILDVRETNLAAQLFFRAIGFTAIRVIPKMFDDDGDTCEDAYRMIYRLPQARN